MRIALIADLHATAATQALEADLKRRGADRLYCLGDLVGKGPSSDWTFDWAVANCDLILGGNWDFGVGYRQYPPDSYYWEQLGEARLAFLRNLPLEKTLTLSGRRIRLFHGRPMMKTLILTQQEAAVIDRCFTDCNASLRCGRLCRRARQPLRTLNPAYSSTAAACNALGTPLCCYAMLEGEERDPAAALDIRLITLPYDREQTLRDARAAAQVPLIDTFIREVTTGQYSR
jgi:protein phosphatase